MTLIKSFHTAAIILLTLYGLPVVRGLQSSASFYVHGAAWLIYAVLFCGLMLNNIWCVRLLVVPPLLIVVLTAPIVIYNFLAFIFAHPLYRDSPATIIVVAVFALFVTVPSAFILVIYWNQRQYIFGRKARS